MCFSAICGSGPAYLSKLLHVYTVHSISYTSQWLYQTQLKAKNLPTPACWKSNNTNARLKAFAPSLALEFTPTSTLDTAQPRHLLKPNWKSSSSHSISIPISVPSFCYSHCVCVFVVLFVFLFFGILNVNCFGRTMLYMCIEHHI